MPQTLISLGACPELKQVRRDYQKCMQLDGRGLTHFGGGSEQLVTCSRHVLAGCRASSSLPSTPLPTARHPTPSPHQAPSPLPLLALPRPPPSICLQVAAAAAAVAAYESSWGYAEKVPAAGASMKPAAPTATTYTAAELGLEDFSERLAELAAAQRAVAAAAAAVEDYTAAMAYAEHGRAEHKVGLEPGGGRGGEGWQGRAGKGSLAGHSRGKEGKGPEGLQLTLGKRLWRAWVSIHSTRAPNAGAPRRSPALLLPPACLLPCPALLAHLLTCPA